MLALGAITVAAATGSAAPYPLAATAAPRPRAVQVIRVTAHGFDWGDAGIGAAAGVGLSMLTVGGGLLVAGTRRSQKPLQRAERSVMTDR